MSAEAHQRLAAFLDPRAPDVFHAVVHTHDVWKTDAADMALIHQPARAAFDRLYQRALRPDADSGRVLLILGESGGGKTHLLRSFRARIRGYGYFAYLRAPVESGPFARHLLHHVTESLERPFDPPDINHGGLVQLSHSLVEILKESEPDAVELLQTGPADDVVTRLTESLLRDRRLKFRAIDDEIVRAVLLLQRDDPPTTAKVARFLRGQELTPADRAALGVVPREPGQAVATIHALARVMTAFQPTVLVVAVDQLDDVAGHADPAGRLREVLATLAELAEAPNVVVVVACLEDTYLLLHERLPAPLRFRVERDPEPVRLTTDRTLDEAERLVTKRLQVLYASELPSLAKILRVGGPR